MNCFPVFHDTYEENPMRILSFWQAMIFAGPTSSALNHGPVLAAAIKILKKRGVEEYFRIDYAFPKPARIEE